MKQNFWARWHNTFGMFLCLAVAAIFIACSCEDTKKDRDKFYVNEDFTVVALQKFPASGRYMIIQRNITPEMHAELTSVNWDPLKDVDIIYDLEVGSTVHFEYINKERFFKSEP